MTSQIPVTGVPWADYQGESTGIDGRSRARELSNRHRVDSFDSEANELGPTQFPLTISAIDSERRSFELTRRQVQMMAFGIYSRYPDLQ